MILWLGYQQAPYIYTQLFEKHLASNSFRTNVQVEWPAGCLMFPKLEWLPCWMVKVRTPNHAKLSWSKLVLGCFFKNMCLLQSQQRSKRLRQLVDFCRHWRLDSNSSSQTAKPSRQLKTDKLLTYYCCEHLMQDVRHPVIVNSFVYHDKQGKSHIHIGSVQQRACVCVCVR